MIVLRVYINLLLPLPRTSIFYWLTFCRRFPRYRNQGVFVMTRSELGYARYDGRWGDVQRRFRYSRPSPGI